MVAKQFDWEDQIHVLNLTENRTANLALIEDAEDAEEQMKDLQHAFMVSTTPDQKRLVKLPVRHLVLLNINYVGSK